MQQHVNRGGTLPILPIMILLLMIAIGGMYYMGYLNNGNGVKDTSKQATSTQKQVINKIIPPSTPAEGTISFEIPKQPTGPGKEFDIKIYADSGTKKFGGFKFNLQFNPKDITINTKAGQDTRKPETSGFMIPKTLKGFSVLANSQEIKNGQYVIAGISTGAEIVGKIHMVTIHAKTLDTFKSGETKISIKESDSELIDDNAKKIKPKDLKPISVIISS